jgi:hypothetical protein
MVRVAFRGFYAALIRAASLISVDQRDSWGNEERGSENVCLHVACATGGNGQASNAI